jgi:hypothetical protein
VNCRSDRRLDACGHAPLSAPNHDAVPLPADFVNVAFNKDAFPTRQPRSPANQSFSLPKQARFFLRKSSSAISGFRSLCGRKQRSSVGHRAQFDLRFGTFSPGAALAMRTLTKTLAFTRWTTGPAPMLWPGT